MATRTTDIERDPDRTGDLAHGEVRYLDLDGDGLPDAVRTTETTLLFRASDATVVRVVDKIEAGIGDDGVPSAVQVTDTLRIGRECIESGFMDAAPKVAWSERTDLAIAAR